MSKSLNMLSELEVNQLLAKKYQPGEHILSSGSNADSLMYIEKGSVDKMLAYFFDENNRINQLPTPILYETLHAGDFIDVESFFSHSARRFDLFAKTEVQIIFLTHQNLNEIKVNDLTTRLELQNTMLKQLVRKNESLNENAITAWVKKAPNDSIDSTVNAAINAQHQLLTKSDVELDALIKDLASATRERLNNFAEKEANCTEIGNVEHKKHKLSLVCNGVLEQLLGLKTNGKLDGTMINGVLEYASPIGVIFAICPLTNPIPNSLFNILNCMKARNAIIISYPQKAVILGEEFVSLMHSVLRSHGLPEELIQTVPQPSSRLNICKFMQHEGIDRVLATGGASLVKEAYRSGTPCLGVGPGNAPALIYKDANLPKAAADIIQSKTYDNGIICGSENNLLVEELVSRDFIESLVSLGAAVLDENECSRVLDLCFDSNGNLNKGARGLSANQIATQIGIARDYQIALFVLVSDTFEARLAQEKLGPFLSMFIAKTENMLTLAEKILRQGGAGHTASIFTNDDRRIDEFARLLPAGRLLVNTPATFGMMGVSTNLPLSFMLGSGSWGKNLTTDAVTWRDFVNIKRLAHHAHTVKV